MLRTNRDRQGGSNCGIYRVTAANPIPETEGICRIDTEFCDLVQCRRDSNEMLGNRFLFLFGIIADDALFTQRLQEPVTNRMGVGDGLQSGEGLRGYDHQSGFGVQILGGLPHVGRVNIGNETAFQALLDVGLQGFVCHDGSKIRAANTHVDNGCHALTGDAYPISAAYTVGEGVNAI